MNMHKLFKDAYHSGNAIKIIGGNSKAFLGNAIEGTPLNLSALSGIIDYEPTELYIKAYAGTPVIRNRSYTCQSPTK